MVARGDLGAELPIEEVPLLQVTHDSLSSLYPLYLSHCDNMLQNQFISTVGRNYQDLSKYGKSSHSSNKHA